MRRNQGADSAAAWQGAGGCGVSSADSLCRGGGRRFYGDPGAGAAGRGACERLEIPQLVSVCGDRSDCPELYREKYVPAHMGDYDVGF